MRKLELPAVVCQDAYPHDPDFPQLEHASDPATMLEIFRAHLEPVAGTAYRIVDCVPFRFRCRQSTARCVLQYTLHLEDPRTGRKVEQWATGLIFAEPGKAERVWREMQASEPLRDFPADWLTFHPASFVPELQMAVELFPYDRRLRNLCRVLQGGLEELEPLLLARLGPGEWRCEERRVEPVRHRTELGAVLRTTMSWREVREGRSETLRCYLKVYRKRHGADEFRLLSTLFDRVAQGKRPYSVVRPLAYWSELGTLVLEEAPGVALDRLLASGLDATAAVCAVARAVAALNQDDLGATKRHTLADQLDDVKRAASLLRWACPQSAEVAAITEAVVSGLEEVPAATIHRDLKADHIFLSAGRVIFVDTDGLSLGDPARDAAHLWAHLVARVGIETLSPERAQAAADAFVEEYFARVPASWRSHFPLHCAGALVEVAGSMFKRQVPEWREEVPAVIAAASRVLERGVR